MARMEVNASATIASIRAVKQPINFVRSVNPDILFSCERRQVVYRRDREKVLGENSTHGPAIARVTPETFLWRAR
jgi:hypothetical protein